MWAPAETMAASNHQQVLQQLVWNSHVLSKTCSEEWAAFLTAFKEYSDQITVAVISASRDDILTAQGAAQQCLSLLELFLRAGSQPPPPPNRP